MLSLRIYYLFREITVNSQFVTRILYESIINPASSPWIHYQLREFFIDLLSFTRFHYSFCKFIMISSSRYQNWSISFFVNSKLIPLLFRGFTMISLSVTWIHYPFRDQYGSINFFLNSELIHYFSSEITLDQLSFSLIHYQFCEFTLDPSSVSQNYCEFTFCHANSLWIHYHISEFTFNSLSFTRIPYWLIIISVNSLSLKRIHFGFIIFFANSLWLHYLFRDFHYEFTINYTNSLWIYYFFREFTMITLSVTRIYYGFIIFFANSLWFHYLFRGFNSQWIPLSFSLMA